MRREFFLFHFDRMRKYQPRNSSVLNTGELAATDLKGGIFRSEAKVNSVVQDNTQERIVDVDPALVLDEAQLRSVTHVPVASQPGVSLVDLHFSRDFDPVGFRCHCLRSGLRGQLRIVQLPFLALHFSLRRAIYDIHLPARLHGFLCLTAEDEVQVAPRRPKSSSCGCSGLADQSGCAPQHPIHP